jgi:two-component system sensor histidine kinase RegB
VGALAAAAAHELGSPLATIAVIAKELARDLPPGSPHTEDAALLLSQSERCRTILADLSRQPVSESGGAPYARLPISALVEAAGEPYRAKNVRVIYATGAGGTGPGGEEPQVARSPEIMHGLGNLIHNAVTFAQREVIVTTDWTEREISVEVVDDGPGFSASVLGRIGEPYISGRSGGEVQHMGLGIFIAQSLLERTGARLGFGNLAEGGAQVMVEWPRAALEVNDRVASREEAGS